VEHPGWLQDHEIQESIYTDQTQSFTLLGKDVSCIPSAVSTNQDAHHDTENLPLHQFGDMVRQLIALRL
jgi:hypothetical protein